MNPRIIEQAVKDILSSEVPDPTSINRRQDESLVKPIFDIGVLLRLRFAMSVKFEDSYSFRID